MATINYIFRKKIEGAHSIEKLFNIIMENVSNHYNKNQLVNPYKLTPIGILKAAAFFRKNTADINHITGDIHWLAIFLNPKNTILTIHDLVGYFKYKGIRKYLYFLFWIYLPIKRLKYVTVISEKTKKEIIDILPWAEKKIVVIPNCLTIKSNRKQNFQEKEKQIMLTIGTLPNKNIERVIKAIKDLPIVLHLIGKLNKTQKKLLKENNISYNNFYNLSEEELIQSYLKADLLCFPSTYEGFGLPILEAQANDCVVITSDIYPTKEVAGNAAVLVNPYEIGEIRNAVKSIINDQELKHSLIKKGRENIKKYEVQNIVNKYQDLYEKMMEK